MWHETATLEFRKAIGVAEAFKALRENRVIRARDRWERNIP
jgi:hypothetical protein